MREWDNFLQVLGSILGSEAVDKWVRPLKILNFDAANLYLESDDPFARDWFAQYVMPHSSKFVGGSGKRIKIHLGKPSKKRREFKELAAQVDYSGMPLDPAQTFSTFFQTKKNQLTLEFLLSDKRSLFNPITLTGPSGSGKSHLANALAQELESQGKKVLFVHAHTFTDHVVTAIRSSEMRPFRAIYRDLDALIIDDIHLLARRSATQEELFHTFNALHMSGKHIILTSSAVPSHLEGIEPRLISRFEWGIVLTLALPEKEESEKILVEKGKALHFIPQKEILEFLITNFSSSFRSILGAFEALAIRAKQPPTLEEAKSLLSDLLEKERKGALTPEKIAKQVSAFFDLKMEDLIGKSQAKEISYPRQLAMYLCRDKLKLPYKQIGYLFQRDHSTVITSIRLIGKKKKDDSDTGSHLLEIEKTFQV